jgi:ABC-type taurine transport system substrate-binding protein
MEARVNRIRRLRLGAGDANGIGEWDAVVVVDGAEVSVRFARKPPDAVREFLRQSGFKWNAAEKEWRCQAEPTEVESQEERRMALAGDFPALLDILSRRRQAAGQATEGLVRKILQALESLRVVVFGGEWVEIHMPDVPGPQESESGGMRGGSE